MLTADMVRARRVGGELRLSPLTGAARQRALSLAQGYIDVARQSVAQPRELFGRLCAEVPVEARDKRLAAGLRKLVEDRCTFEADPPRDPRVLRAALFGLASVRRRSLVDGEALDRAAIVAQVAADQSLSAEELERLLYADLRAAHRLLTFLPLEAAELVAIYELAQAQAVLLRAYQVRAELREGSPELYRRLFRKLKFLQLLCAIVRLPDGEGYRLEIDGPYSMFRAVTKYGLQLALLLPLIREFGHWSLEAEVKWAKRGGRLTFRQEGRAAVRSLPAVEPDDLPAEAQRLMQRFSQQIDGAWTVQPCRELLVLEGVGVCVPDLVFEHRASRFRAYFESLGYWSRKAVWQRVELVEKGLTQPILFAVSDHLRVSEQALAGDAPAALYVYKRVMSRKAVEQKLETMRRRAAPRNI